MARAVLVVLLLLAGCAGPSPRDRADKEVYVEGTPTKPPCRECGRAYEAHEADPLRSLARQKFKFPLPPLEIDRCYAVARPLNPEADKRLAHLAVLVAASQEQPFEKKPEPGKSVETPEPKKEAPRSDDSEKPTALLWFPDRPDLRNESACYLGHSCYLEGAVVGDFTPIHHFRLFVANREGRAAHVDLGSFRVTGDSAMTSLAIASERGVGIEKLEVPPASDGVAHLFFKETTGLSPILTVSWSVRLVALDGAVDERSYAATLVRRYVAREAPLTPLEDHVARGVPLLQQGVQRGPWIDPGLESIGGAR